MSKNDDVFGILRGSLDHPRAREAQIVGVFLGSSLGACIDLGRSDAEILDLCQRLLHQIRSSMSNPEAKTAIEMIQNAATKPHD